MIALAIVRQLRLESRARSKQIHRIEALLPIAQLRRTWPRHATDQHGLFNHNGSTSEHNPGSELEGCPRSASACVTRMIAPANTTSRLAANRRRGARDRSAPATGSARSADTGKRRCTPSDASTNQPNRAARESDACGQRATAMDGALLVSRSGTAFRLPGIPAAVRHCRGLRGRCRRIPPGPSPR